MSSEFRVPESSREGFRGDVLGLLSAPDLGAEELVACVELRRVVWGLSCREARVVLRVLERNPM